MQTGAQPLLLSFHLLFLSFVTGLEKCLYTRIYSYCVCVHVCVYVCVCVRVCKICSEADKDVPSANRGTTRHNGQGFFADKDLGITAQSAVRTRDMPIYTYS